MMQFHRMTLVFLLGIAVLTGACALATLSADDSPKSESPKIDKDVRIFMRAKLDASTKVLEGLTTENFAMIRDGAKSLQAMSKAEKWRVSNDPLYRQYSLEFSQLAERLGEKANSRNVDGATLSWMECTMSCIRCHNYARTIRIAIK